LQRGQLRGYERPRRGGEGSWGRKCRRNYIQPCHRKQTKAKKEKKGTPAEEAEGQRPGFKVAGVCNAQGRKMTKAERRLAGGEEVLGVLGDREGGEGGVFSAAVGGRTLAQINPGMGAQRFLVGSWIGRQQVVRGRRGQYMEKNSAEAKFCLVTRVSQNIRPGPHSGFILGAKSVFQNQSFTDIDSQI